MMHLFSLQKEIKNLMPDSADSQIGYTVPCQHWHVGG